MEYRLSDLKVADVQNEANRVLSALTTDAGLREEARKAGVDLPALDAVLASEAPERLIQVERQGAGFDQATTAIIVAFAPVAAKILLDVWNYLILPRIRGKHGPDAVQPVASKGDK